MSLAGIAQTRCKPLARKRGGVFLTLLTGSQGKGFHACEVDPSLGITLHSHLLGGFMDPAVVPIAKHNTRKRKSDENESDEEMRVIQL